MGVESLIFSLGLPVLSRDLTVMFWSARVELRLLSATEAPDGLSLAPRSDQLMND